PRLPRRLGAHERRRHRDGAPVAGRDGLVPLRDGGDARAAVRRRGGAGSDVRAVLARGATRALYRRRVRVPAAAGDDRAGTACAGRSHASGPGRRGGRGRGMTLRPALLTILLLAGCREAPQPRKVPPSYAG